MDTGDQAPQCYSMDGLLQSLQSEMRQARSEGCRLAKTMWNMYNAFEGVVGEISPSQHQEAQFFKCEKRHSMISSRTPPAWRSQGNVYIAMSPTCQKQTNNSSSSPSYDIKKQLSVSNPALPNCHTNDINTLLKKCQISDELTEHHTSDECMSEDYICQEESQYSDWITDEMSQLRADNVNSLLRAEECKLDSESGISSGYNTRECTPVGYTEEEIELMNQRYNNLLDCRESTIEGESNIDEVCDNLYENLKQFDSFLKEGDTNIKKTIIPNNEDNRFFTQLCGAENSDGILQLRSASSCEDPVEELRNSVAKLNLDKSHVQTLHQICGYNSPRIDPENSCSRECQFGSPANGEHMDPAMIEELELDAEVAYIMSRATNKENKESRKRTRVSDFHSRASTTRRPSVCSDSTDSGRGSWVSQRSADSKPTAGVRPRGSFGSGDLPFKAVEHFYETIPGEDCATPVPWSHIKMDNLTETNIDDVDDKDSVLDNTYASLNVSQMLDEFSYRPATPPQLPSRRRMPRSNPHKTNSTQCSNKQPAAKVTRTEGNQDHQKSVCHKLSPGLPKYDEVIASDGHHTYTIADVLESVDNFAGHLPKARENLYSLVRNKKARRRLSECLKSSPVPVVQTPERLLAPPVENHGRFVPASDNKTDIQRETRKLTKSRSDEFQTQFDNDDFGVSTRKTYKRSRRSLPNHPVTEGQGQTTKTVWNYDLLKSHAIFC